AAPATVTGDDPRFARCAPLPTAGRERGKDDPEARRPTAANLISNVPLRREGAAVNFLFVLFLAAATPQKISDRIVVTASDVAETIQSKPAALPGVTQNESE